MKAEQAKKTRQTLFALMLIALAGAVAGMYYRSQKKKEAERLRGEVKSAIEEARKLRAEGNLIKAAEKLKVALEKARNLGDVKAEVELELSKLGEELSKALSQGDALLAEGKYAEAIKAYESALPLAQALGREKEVKEKISLAERKAEEDKKRRELEKLLAEISGAVERKDYERVKELMDNVEPLAKELNAERKLEAIKAELKTRLENLTARAREEELSGNYSQALALYTEALSIAGVIGESGGEIRKAITTIEERQMEELLRKSVRIEVPSEMAHKAENEVSILVTNRFSGDISVSVDLSANRDYFELSEEKVEFPRVKPGKTIGEDVTVKPKFLGEFDFTVKVNSSAGSFEKRVPVKVVKTARAGATPTPTLVTSTPVINPVESLTELYSEMQYIGEGGFARVYKAKRKDGKVVAVKIPKTLDPAIGRAFVREISNWLHLKHSNIVELYDVNVIPIPYLEMEYCESSLAKLPKPLPLEEASLIVFNIAEGLKYAHSKKIVHRDLKPSNVLLKNGLPKISDWGLSKVLEESMSATTTASFTPFYAAPEQIDRKFGHTDERTDIWQLGVIFYELVTGRLPFEGSLSQVMMGIIRDDPVPPSEINPEAKKVEPIIMKMLAKRKEERYQSIEELQRDLAGVLNLTYSESLKKSKTMGDVRRAAYYLTELLLINMKTNNVGEAYKYATDLVLYARGELKDEVRKLAEQQKLKEKTNYESFKINGNEARKFSQRELKKLFEECLKSNGAIISLKTEEQEAIIFIPIREDLEWN
ncbi:MAG: eukaryotic-like serine/threonine-protein kinase [Thermococcaceae archaeon]|jgi:serine/threonine protein kinase/tetratricopeptide (TPR) repeat protein|nr:eukaryotic-like serine/threonine-protein kinase [Thermococcaceae archaeon]